MSPKFKQEEGFVFRIFSNEEERKHIHVVKAENEAKYWLEPEIELAENFGIEENNKNGCGLWRRIQKTLCRTHRSPC